MFLRTFTLMFLVMLVPAVIISCGMKDAPDDEKEKKEDTQRSGALVYKTSTAGNNQVYSIEGRDVEGSSVVVPSVSVYDYMERVRETLGRESKINVDEACLELLEIGQTNPTALEIDVKVNMECASVPEGEASHTDPSPLDDTDSWIICGPQDSGGVGGGPGTEPPGGGPGGDAPSANTGDGGDSEQPAAIGAIQNILCGPAVPTRPGGVDPRLVYPDPNTADGMIVQLDPCVREFCPWKLIPIPIDPEDDPSDPIDPSPEDDVELPDEIKAKLPCDQFKGLCEPSITMIDKSDLVKEDTKGTDDLEAAEDGDCDGKDKNKQAESCKEGNVGQDEEWTVCVESTASDATVCVEHNPESEDGEYTVRWVNHNDSNDNNANPDDRDHEAIQLVNSLHHDDNEQCKATGVGQGQDGSRTGSSFSCN